MSLSAAAPSLPTGIGREYLLWHRMCPVGFTADGRLRVAITTGVIEEGLGELSLAYDAEIDTEEVTQPALDALIERASNRSATIASRAEEPETGATDLRDLANEPPVIRYVNMLLREAHEAAASDIHLEGTRDGLTARFRLDGVLVPAAEPPRPLHQAVLSRVKLLAEMDISERRRSQDGRMRVRLESSELDIRVSTVPTAHGESVVMRLLDRGGASVGLEDLGMSHATLDAVDAIARKPHGMLLVTGPTGSGKTTTLYAAMRRRDATTEKIITVEDPIEYHVPDITQVPVHRQVGVTFATALRSILRQDPDVLMVGEMRDRETAEIAIQASMTGHFVFTTLHTNDAPSAIPRLIDLGVPDYLVTATVEAILAQRLVRRICEGCRVKYEPAPDQVAAVSGRPVGRTTLSRGSGCTSCRGTGFRGRIGLFELLLLSDRFRECVTRRASRQELLKVALDEGMASLRQDGWDKVLRGITTVEEVIRVTQD